MYWHILTCTLILSSYQGRYRKWCKVNNFVSMLPEDSKACCDAVAEKLKQLQLNDHFTVIPEEEKPTPYTGEVFKEAAIQWLIETDQVLFCCSFKTHLWFFFFPKQPIQAFEHPTFKHMISVASRPTKGAKIPNRKQSCDEIISTFKKQMMALKDHLNVSLCLSLWTCILTVTLECSCKGWG